MNEGKMGVKLVPFNDLKRLYERFAPLIEGEVSKTLASGWWISGKSCEAFASRFADFVGVSHCIPVGNGTDAIEIALKAVRNQGRNEVVTVANAGGYTSAAARNAGLVPVFADIERDSLLMSISSAVSRIGSRTAAVMATHLFGNVIDIVELRQSMDVAGYSDVPIVEDCAQAHGATLAGRIVGSLADIGTFSFYPTKNLGAMGDAGAIVTNEDAYADRARSLMQYGWAEKYRIAVDGGRNSRMDELQAAILVALLPHLSELNGERAQLRKAYEARLPPALLLPASAPGAVAHLVPVLTEDRNDFRRFLQQKGIGTDIHYPVLDCDQAGWHDLEKPELPVSRWAVDRIVSIPCFAGMRTQELDAVCDAISEFYS